ncbi:hypothetical protein GCM10008018_31310 [Paenibacillus marchantiophytorum]|uniref:Uncharacterized protein n=1 Tax=Paenibacillus marchantiophytorum TaxID=1619310 RepID=A0ABQ1EQU7_9BACL|nr:hypothetical protein GCM10008018_31310 [Paenibacillus marchantiophytorum]
MPGIFSAIAILIKQLTLLVSYVKNNAFPQPLTNDHSRNKLIEHNLRLVAHIVKRL